MTKKQFDSLDAGDIIRPSGPAIKSYVVTGNYGDRVTAVRTVDVTNPNEWDLMLKVTERTTSSGEKPVKFCVVE